MSQFALPTEGGLLRRPQSTAAPSPEFDAARAQRERRRRETELRQLDQRIRSQRARDRREGTTTDFTNDLLRRDQIGDDLLRISTALRPERQQTTADQVLERRQDLQRQGLSQAQADLDRASAPPSPEAIESVRDAAERRAVAAARSRRGPASNVPANELLPSNLARTAAGELMRSQGSAIDDASRRVDAFEGFGLTVEQATAQAAEANAAAARRNTERANARSELADLFLDRDAEEAAADAQRQRVLQATREREIAQILAERRAAERVGQPDPEAAARLRLLEAQAAGAETEVERNRAALEAEQMLIDQSKRGAALTSPESQSMRDAARQREEFGDDADTAMSKLVTAMELNTGGGFTTEEVARNRLMLAEAMNEIKTLPDALRSQVAGDALSMISHTMGRSVEGTVPQFLANVLGETFSLDFDFLRRDEANSMMRRGPQQQIRQLAAWAGLDVDQVLDQPERPLRGGMDPNKPPQSTEPTVFGSSLSRRPAWARDLSEEEWARTGTRRVQLQ